MAEAVNMFLLLVLHHPIFSLIAIGCIVLCIKVQGLWDFVVFGILFVTAFYHDKVVSAKK